MKGFGEALGLETQVDPKGNVIIRKPATPGMENKRGVIFQGHLDMVPQANSDSTHNFSRDPIETRIEGEWVTATGTTLGADNGIGVAAAMAVLAAEDLQHGPLEALFTSNEEDGMTGAFGLKPGLLQGEILLNMDSEDEGVLCIGCAGGGDSTSRINYSSEPVSGVIVGFRLSLTGLKGGHSGVDIHRGRGNANKLLFRMLKYASDRHQMRVCSASGGNLRNAIPREAFAEVTVPQNQVEGLIASVAAHQGIYRSELSVADPDVTLALEQIPIPAQWIEKGRQAQFLDLICAAPNGVIRMSDAMPGLVETSTNLAIVRAEDGIFEVQSLVRSSVDSARDSVCAMLDSLFSLAGGETRFNGAYPGWKPDMASLILSTMQQVYLDLFGSSAEIGGIHAGLECGILGDSYPNLDMISFGPTIRYPHSPDERLHIPSVERFWDLLVATLEQIPER